MANGPAARSLQFEVERTEVLTPKWTGILPILERAMVCGGAKGQQAAHENLFRMAQGADAFNDLLDQTKREACFDDPGYV